MRDYPDLTGTADDKNAARQARSAVEDFTLLDALSWRDLFWADVTAVLAERDPEKMQLALTQLTETNLAWFQALSKRTARGNEQGT